MIPDAYFERFATAKYRERSALKRALLRRFVERFHSLFLRANPVESVLEVGMGEGFLSGYLSERFPHIHFEGVDLDRAALARAAALFPRIVTRPGDAHDLRVAGRSFDLVLCCEVLEHVADPARALAEIAAVTRGHAIVTVPHEPFFRLSNLLRGRNVRRLGNDVDHLHQWGPGSFRRLLARHFRVVELTASYPFLLALVAPRPS